MLKDQDGHVGAEMVLCSQFPLLNVTPLGIEICRFFDNEEERPGRMLPRLKSSL